MPGPHGFAVRYNAIRPARCDRSRKSVNGPALRSHHALDAAASTASRPNVRDDGQRPSCETGWLKLVEVICPTAQAKYFWRGDWTTQITLIGLKELEFASMSHECSRRPCVSASSPKLTIWRWSAPAIKKTTRANCRGAS